MSSFAQAELYALTTRYEGQMQAIGYEREARMERWHEAQEGRCGARSCLTHPIRRRL